MPGPESREPGAPISMKCGKSDHVEPGSPRLGSSRNQSIAPRPLRPPRSGWGAIGMRPRRKVSRKPWVRDVEAEERRDWWDLPSVAKKQKGVFGKSTLYLYTALITSSRLSVLAKIEENLRKRGIKKKIWYIQQLGFADGHPINY